MGLGRPMYEIEIEKSLYSIYNYETYDLLLKAM